MSRSDVDRSALDIACSSDNLRRRWRRAAAAQLRHFKTNATALLSDPAASAPLAATSSGCTAAVACFRCSEISYTEAEEVPLGAWGGQLGA